MPAAVWIALRSLRSASDRVRFLVAARSLRPVRRSGVLSLLGRDRHPGHCPPDRDVHHVAALDRFPFPQPGGGKAAAQTWVSRAALALTALFALWQAWKAGKEPGWTSFARSGLNILVFYLLVTCLWFQQWYPVWLVGLAAILPAGLEQGLGIWVGFASLTKPLVFGPLVFLQKPPDPQKWLELRLSAGVMILSWLAAWWVMWLKLVRYRDKPAD